MEDFIPVNEPLIGEKEKEFVMDCLNTGWISSEGSYVKEFQNKFSRIADRKFGIACSSGTAALEIAIASLNIGPGDEVILPTFTIISCAAAIIRSGATPVLVDCDPSTFNTNPEEIIAAVTKKTVAIMIVHIYGLPVDLDPILKLAKENKIFIIEDAAELIGAEYKGKICGSFGDISTFSFYSNKHITTGEGGMIVTNDKAIANRCASLKNLCFKNEKRFIHEELGWNYRMTNLQAALGLGQLMDLKNRIKKKRWIGELYNKIISDDLPVRKPIKKVSYAENIYWVYTLVLDDPSKDANEIMDILKNKGIGCRPFFYPIHKQPVFLKKGLFKDLNLPNSEKLYKKGFYLPSGLTLDYKKIEFISETINQVLK